MAAPEKEMAALEKEMVFFYKASRFLFARSQGSKRPIFLKFRNSVKKYFWAVLGICKNTEQKRKIRAEKKYCNQRRKYVILLGDVS